jgi:hypothetical protein
MSEPTPKEHLLTVLQQFDAAVNGAPRDQLLLFGSAPLAIRNLRHIGDLDIYTTPEFWADLESQRWWNVVTPRPDDPSFLERYIEGYRVTVFCDWTERTWSPNLDYYLKHPEWIEGWPFLDLVTILEWKRRRAVRDKDVGDIALIEEYLAQYGVEAIQ